MVAAIVIKKLQSCMRCIEVLYMYYHAEEVAEECACMHGNIYIYGNVYSEKHEK